MRKNMFYTAISIFLVAIMSCGNKTANPVIDYSNLSKSGNWEIIQRDSSLFEGHIKLKNEIWLMNFLHWWPLTKSNSNISSEYAKNLLMNLWGMQFNLTGAEGETKVNGHQAFWIEGKLGEVVKTRFIVWNCPESKRQFLSDCNINISLKTPDTLLILQSDDITNSVCCHHNNNKTNNPRLPQQIEYKDQNITLNIPENWRSNLYYVNSDTTIKTPGHYLNGCTEKQGSLWNLLSESQKEINLIWKNNDEISMESSSTALLENYFADTVFAMQDTFRLFSYYTHLNPLTFIGQKGYMKNSGFFDMVTEVENYYPIDTSRYRYQSFFWRGNNADYLLLASMVAYDNFWGIPFDLAPTEEQFKDFINNDVLKNISSHQIILE